MVCFRRHKTIGIQCRSHSTSLCHGFLFVFVFSFFFVCERVLPGHLITQEKRQVTRKCCDLVACNSGLGTVVTLSTSPQTSDGTAVMSVQGSRKGRGPIDSTSPETVRSQRPYSRSPTEQWQKNLSVIKTLKQAEHLKPRQICQKGKSAQ